MLVIRRRKGGEVYGPGTIEGGGRVTSTIEACLK